MTNWTNQWSAPPPSGANPYARPGFAPPSYGPRPGFTQPSFTPPGFAPPGYGPPPSGQPMMYPQQSYQQPGYQQTRPTPGYPPPGYQQPIYGIPIPQRPGRKGIGLGAIIITLVFVGIIALGGLMAIGLVAKLFSGPTTPPMPYPGPTLVDKPSMPAPKPSTVAPKPSTSAPKPVPETKVPPITKNPPPAPQPETYTEAKELLLQNKFYLSQIRPADCQGTAIEPGTTSKAKYQLALDNMTACLMKVWINPITQAGYQVYRPSVTIYAGEITTKCGKAKPQNAFFCSADQQIYFANDMPSVIASVTEPSAHLSESIIAHEFGHLLQFRTGMLVSAHAFAEKAESKSDTNEWIRRLEGNADCLAGMYTRAVSASEGLSEQDIQRQVNLFRALGDDNLTGDENIDGDHGLGATRMQWFLAGVNNTQVKTCDSFAATKERVR